MNSQKEAIAIARPNDRNAIWAFIFLFFAVVAIAIGMLQSRSSAAPPATTPVSTNGSSTGDLKDGEALATFAGGCFWCTEAVFERMEGVNDVISGYIGGHVANPTYQMVLTKRSGHAEACEIYYDPSKVTYEELMEVFFKTHDPTSLNRQGADAGPQYRSSIFFHDEEQKKLAEQYIEKLNKSGDYRKKIVTALEEATTFYPAEEYHQDYFRRNPNAGYCRSVVAAKVRKFNRTFKDKIKK